MRACVLTLALLAGSANAQLVNFSGRMGERALLVINGTPRTLAIGVTASGVKLIAVNANEATVEMAGQRATLQLGGSPVNLGAVNSAGGGSQIVLTAGSGGHFVTGGSINGRAVRFLVDTGATMVSLGQADADRLGLKYMNGERGLVSTANGQVPVHRASIDVLRVGDVQVYNVDALVMPMQMDMVLLGNSFLTRFQMKRDGDVMRLDLRR